MLLGRIFITAAVQCWDWQQVFGKKLNNKTANCTAVNHVVLYGIFHVYCQPAAAAAQIVNISPLPQCPDCRPCRPPPCWRWSVVCWCLCRGRGVARLRVVAAAARTVCAVVGQVCSYTTTTSYWPTSLREDVTIKTVPHVIKRYK